MARIKYNASLNSFQEIWDGIDDAELTVKRDRGDKVVVTDADGNELEFSGKNLDWSEGGLVGGVIRELSLSNEKGKELFEIKDVKIDAATFQGAFNEGGLDVVLSVVLGGGDDIKGSKGNDWLYGFGGDDKLTGDKGSDYLFGGDGKDLLIGGHGSDYFVFETGLEGDMVKDFGFGKKDGDFIAADAALVETATWEQEGENLRVTFGEAGSIVLKNVEAEDFSISSIVALDMV
jgi:Ca2+-binding RTX toxin-like protein